MSSTCAAAAFVAASSAEHSGTGPYVPYADGQPDG